MTTSAALADTRRMTTATTRIKRSGPAIRAVLAEVSPDECAQFEVEFAQALALSTTWPRPRRCSTAGGGSR